MNKVKELKNDNTLWAKPAKLVDLLDFKPEKLSIETKNDWPDIKVHQVRYENSGFYFLMMIKKINIIKYGKKLLKLLIIKMEN